MMSESLKVKMIIGAGVATAFIAAWAAYSNYRKRQLQVAPLKWRKIGTVEEIYIFPIKSCAAIPLDRALCENLGIREHKVRDRALMLIDKDGKTITCRTYPKMLKIQPKILASGSLLISAPGMDDLEFDYQQVGAENRGNIKANLWNTDVYVMHCGEKFDKWFSNYILGKEDGCRLVYYPYPIPTRQIVGAEFDNGVFLQSDTGTLGDVSSYMLMHENSVNELNTRLETKVEPLNFRGNFVIRTHQAPYAEDHWEWIKIGEETIFRVLAPCYRCIMPNINPHTAERDTSNEPLKTLKSYRVHGNLSKDPQMGVQMGIRQTGNLKKGDSIYIEEH